MINADILVVGGGASGLAAAISAKQAGPRLTVAVAEALPRCGKKLLATGNGRCNLMNTQASPSCYAGAEGFILPALEAYRAAYPRFWDGLGLRLRTEGTLVYPASNQASSVLDVLRLALSDLGIREYTETPVTSVKKTPDGFVCGDIACRRLILATGGRAGKGLGENDSFVNLLKPLGHTFTPVYPALTHINVPRGDIAGLKGIRLKGRVHLLSGENVLGSEDGELLFSDEAVSGIAAMQLSLIAAPLIKRRPLALSIAICPEDQISELRRRRSLFPGRMLEEYLTGLTVRRVALLSLRRAGLNPLSRSVSSLTDAELARLNAELTDWRLNVTGTGTFTEAQVMLGGVDTHGFDPLTLESKRVPHLYCCGEMLDVTGKCGGFNLEWAWASGILAGRKAAESL